MRWKAWLRLAAAFAIIAGLVLGVSYLPHATIWLLAPSIAAVVFVATFRAVEGASRPPA